jgi:AcrR family transcriptional regulator
MSPRGIAIADVRHHLFDAAEVILLRDGDDALTGRAVSREAGCAVGVLQNHFGDFESFLGELAVDRLRRRSAAISHLPQLAGTATVMANVTEAALTLFSSETLALSRLLLSRPQVATRALQARSAGAPARPVLQEIFTSYLESEQRIGRVSPGADAVAIALALVSAVHQLLLMPGGSVEDSRDTLRRVVRALITGIATPEG